MSTWQTNVLRLTAFPSSSVKFDSRLWWETAVGNEPDNTSSKRHMEEKTYEGAFSGGKLTLTTNPLRIDWLYMPFDSSEEGELRFLSLGILQEKLPTFEDLVKRWLKSSLEFNLVRIAFGAVLLQSVNSREEGYNILVPYLPNVKIDAINSSDLFYQINRPRLSTRGIDNLNINRLSKWSVARLKLDIGSPSTPRVIHQAPDIYAARLELDVNTFAEFDGELSPHQLLGMFNELIEFGKEIAEKGDIP